MKKFKVLILQNSLSDNDGSSFGLVGLLNDLDFIQSYKILTLNNRMTSSELNVSVVKSFDEVRDEIYSNDYDIIHNFRVVGSDLIKWTLKALEINNKKIPIITTVNQRPSFILSLLTPEEIRNSYKIVLIDQASYNNKLISFIPENRKCLNYYCTSRNEELFENFYSERLSKKIRSGDKVIFGRGSTLNKCPKDVIEIFQKIDIPNKEFRIYGVSKGSWLEKMASSFDNVKVFPLLPLSEWYEALKDFDIFLYQLPKYSHASLDGTLGAAMKFGIPAVYYGPEAAKERFVNGVNGFVANTKTAIVEYATLLGKDEELRLKIGKEGRNSTLKKLDWRKTHEVYHKLYEEASVCDDISVPLKYQFVYVMAQFCVKIRNQFRGIIQEFRRIKFFFSV